MNTDQNNKLIIISSPSGAGKTTLCKLLIKKMKNVHLSISYTSRNKRLNEVNGKDYYFVSKKKFEILKNKNHILFDIDWKGARKIRRNFKKSDVIDIFILPPSKKELKRRLVKRGRDNNKEIDLRLSYAITEMKHYSEYKFVLINENVQKTVNKIKKIIEYNDLMFEQKNILKNKLNKIINL